MQKSRYVLLIEGTVQKGGFRSFIKKRALMFGITGYAENLPSREVIVVLEGEENKITELIEIMEKQALAFIEVERINKRKEEYQGSFTDFERKGSDVLEGLEDKGVKEILLNIASYSKSTDEKLENGVKILGDIKTKQDEHIEIGRGIAKKQDEHVEISREISHTQREHIKITKKGFESVTKELKGHKEIHEEIMELKEEFTRLKEALRDAGMTVS